MFGANALSRLPSLVSEDRVLLLTTVGSTRRGLTHRIVELLRPRKVTIWDQIPSNIDTKHIDQLAHEFVNFQPNCIIAAGGGSAIDSAKVLSRLIPVSKNVTFRALLEKHKPHHSPNASIPVIAIPTTAGTGAEVTPFATVWDREALVKHSFTFDDPYPAVALLDPKLTLSLPRDLTLSTGLDALCQALESLWSVRSNPVSRAYAQTALPGIISTMPLVLDTLGDLEFRTQMMEYSLLAGLAIAISKTTLAHSISYPLTLHMGVPHGLACSLTIVQVLELNSSHDEEGINRLVRRAGFSEVGELAKQLRDLLKRTGAYKILSNYVVDRKTLVGFASQAIATGRADNNPVRASVSNVEDILATAFEEIHLTKNVKTTRVNT